MWTLQPALEAKHTYERVPGNINVGVMGTVPRDHTYDMRIYSITNLVLLGAPYMGPSARFLLVCGRAHRIKS